MGGQKVQERGAGEQPAQPLAAALEAGLAVEFWPLARLAPYARNPRRNAHLVERLAEVIREFGFLVPILARSSGEIVDGHLRVAAARKLGLKEVPVVIVDGLTSDQVKAFRLVVNKSVEWAEWDADLLRLELEELDAADFDLALTGFAPDELDELLAPVGDDDAGDGPACSGAAPSEAGEGDGPDDAPPEPAGEPITRPGDLWALGEHRLLCGDSTRPEDVRRLLGDARPDLILTDPPYCSGGFQEAGKRGGSLGTRGDDMIANDTLSSRGYAALLKASLGNIGAGVAYVFTDWRMWVHLFDVVESCGYGVRNMIVWDKETPGMGVGWRMQHELIMCGVRVKSPFNPKTAQGNVLRCKRSGNKHHPTEKPVELLAQVLAVTDLARTVCDPFAGSGSTLLACERVGRTCLAMELEPRHCDAAVRRWEAETGRTAERIEAGDGRE